MFSRINQWTHLNLMLFFFRSLLIIDLLLFIAKVLFRFSTSFCVNFGRLCYSRTWLISSRLSDLWAQRLMVSLCYLFDVHEIHSDGPLPFLILVICVLSLFFLAWLEAYWFYLRPVVRCRHIEDWHVSF